MKVTGPVSYHVETENGIVIRRRTDQLRLRYTKLPEFHSELQDFSNNILDDIDDFPVSKAPHTTNTAYLYGYNGDTVFSKHTV